MNCPHTKIESQSSNRQEDKKSLVVDNQFGRFIEKAFALWQDEGTAEQRAAAIAKLAQSMLPNFDDEETDEPATRNNTPHTQSNREELESVAEKIFGIQLRKTSRSISRQSQEDACNLCDVQPQRIEQTEDDVLEAAIARRLAKNLTARQDGYHQY